jgi:hypothetical protein
MKKKYNEELHNLYSSPNITRKIKSRTRKFKYRRMRLAGHVVRTKAKMNAYMILVGKPEGKRPLGIPRRR